MFLSRLKKETQSNNFIYIGILATNTSIQYKPF